MSDEKKNVYEIVTERIVELLDKGVVPWKRPWRTSGFLPPISSRGHRYRGINVLILAIEQQFNGYKSPIWLSFKQANELGGGVKEGEKSTLVTFWKRLMVDEKDTHGNLTGKKKAIPLLRYFRVFNIEQTAGVKLPKKMQAIHDAATSDVYEGGLRPEDTHEAAQAILDGYDGPPFFYGGGKAYYIPAKDEIHIPNKEDFDTVDEWFATHFHEIGHSTGHESRLNRKGIADFDHFGSGKYAEEELVAELTAAFLMGEAGIDATIENSAAYIASWKGRIQADPKLIVNAAAKAQKAADLVLGRTFETESDSE